MPPLEPAGTLPEPLRALANLGVRHEYPPNAFLLSTGDESTSVLVLEAGLLRLQRTTAVGRRILMDLVSPGRLVGELGVLGLESRSVSVVTVEPSTVWTVPGPAFIERYRADHDLANLVTQRMADTIRTLNDLLVQAAGGNATERIAGRLMELLLRSDDSPKEPVDLPLPISQEELGQWAGLSREATAKALRDLRRRGVISTGRKLVTIHDLAALEIEATHST